MRLRNLQLAVGSYQVDYGVYPMGTGASALAKALPLLQQYLDDEPLDLTDGWGFPLRYRGTRCSFVLWSTGGDGKDDPVTQWGPAALSADQVIGDDGWWQWPEGICCYPEIEDPFLHVERGCPAPASAAQPAG